MRILMLTASLPYPPASGGAIRTFGILKGLYEAGHHLTLLSFHEGAIPPLLSAYCARIITCPPPHRSIGQRLKQLLLSPMPDIAFRFYSPQYATLLRELILEEHFDLIQCEAIEIACYLPLAKQWGTSKICFDTFNAEAELQRAIFLIERQNPRRWLHAIYALIQTRRIARYEKQLCRLADCVLAVSPEDASFLSQYRDDQKTYVIPSGIFVNDYAEISTDISLKQPSIVFTGKMDYRPNIDAMLWFTQSVWPHILRAFPQAHLYIVGQKPHASLTPLDGVNNIVLTGWVDDVRPYLQNASVYVAPLRMGSGTRLKLLEAMASGCAIVSTPLAASGLTAEICEGMQITNTVEGFVEAITHLLNHPIERQHLGQRARQLVGSTYDWSALIPRLLKVYEEIGLG